MKNGFFFAGILFTLAAELAILILFMTYGTEIPQNTVAINEVLQTLESDWGSLEKHVPPRTWTIPCLTWTEPSCTEPAPASAKAFFPR